MADFRIKTDNQYSAIYRNGKTGFSVGYYTAKEMKDFFPGGTIRVVGQLGYGKDKDIVGALEVGGVTENVYRVRSAANKKAAGYIELENGAFIAVKKDITALIILFVLLGVLVLALLIAGITYAVKASSHSGETQTESEPYGELAGDQEEGFGQLDLPEKADVSEKEVTIIGIPEMYLKAGQKQQNFILSNSSQNEGICFMEFTVYIDKNGDKKIDAGDEQLYKSGLVRPGYSISKFNLNRELDAGEYDGLVMEQPYSYDKARTPLNNMVISTKIIAE